MQLSLSTGKRAELSLRLGRGCWCGSGALVDSLVSLSATACMLASLSYWRCTLTARTCSPLRVFVTKTVYRIGAIVVVVVLVLVVVEDRG